MPDPTVFELRRYRLKPGARETLIGMFDAELLEPQLACGMGLPGQYRDLDDPDAFVWLRAFPDMERRAQALASFYTGPAWAAHKDAANATMINSDNVLLLKPTGPEPPFSSRRAGAGGGLITVSVASLARGREAEVAAFFQREMRPALAGSGARIDATFVSEHSSNSFPRLPVREGESVFVWVSAFADVAAFNAHRDALASNPGWPRSLYPRFDGWLWRPLETARLSPTARSSHRW